MTRLQKYLFSHAQLQAYIQAFTNDSEVIVLADPKPQSHVPSKVVGLPIGTPHAASDAAHEALHILHSSHYAQMSMRNEAERAVLNVLDDARIERLGAQARPGLKPQFQEDINDLTKAVLKEQWISQALKAMYLKAAGYSFPYAKLDPRAARLLAKFEPLIPSIHNAVSDADLIPVVREVIALFDEPLVSPSEPAAAESAQTSSPRPTAQPASAGTSRATTSEAPETGILERDAVTYDAGEAAARLEAERRLASGPGGIAPTDTIVHGQDRVTGGPTVNQLILQAHRVRKDLADLDAKRKRNALAALTKARRTGKDIGLTETGGASSAHVPYAEEAETRHAARLRLPRSMAPVADLERELDRNKSLNLGIDWKSLVTDHDGSVAYYSRAGWTMADMRTAQGPYADHLIDTARASAAQHGPIANYLARQLRVFLQSEDRRSMRDYERIGLLDPRRSFHMGAGRFDVFRNPPNPRDARPVVALTIDMSGSMGGWTNSPAFHAMNTAIVMAQALHKLHIPFEVHGFNHGGYVFKTFDEPFTHRVLSGLSNIMQPRGGTFCGEALAVAWTRALARPEPRKIVFVITDGGVANNTGAIARSIEASGGIVVGVGIGKGVAHNFFPHSVEVNNASELPGVFTTLLKRLLPTGRWA